MVRRPGTGVKRRRRQLALVSSTLVLAVALGACASNEAGEMAAEQVVAVVPPVEEATTTTTTVPEEVVEDLPQPISIPRDSYAPEAIVELGTIEIPKIGLYHRTMQGVTLRNIDHGPSHWPGTALPGEPGNTVFAGHRVTRTHPFRNIDQLEPGDEVIFTVGDVRSHYRVTGSLVVGPSDSWIANQTTNATGTLYACHPPGSAAYRYVVRLELA